MCNKYAVKIKIKEVHFGYFQYELGSDRTFLKKHISRKTFQHLCNAIAYKQTLMELQNFHFHCLDGRNKDEFPRS